MKTKNLSWANREKVNQRKDGEKQDFADAKREFPPLWSIEVVRKPSQSQSTGEISQGNFENQISLQRRKTSPKGYINKVQDEYS